MAPLTVYIGTSDPATYSRNPPVVHPEDEVTFVLVGRTDAVTVTFSPSSPFGASNSFGLDGASSSTSSQGEEVLSSTDDGTYSFTATPNTSIPHSIDPDRPGTVSGDIEVTRDSGGPVEG